MSFDWSKYLTNPQNIFEYCDDPDYLNAPEQLKKCKSIEVIHGTEVSFSHVNKCLVKLTYSDTDEPYYCVLKCCLGYEHKKEKEQSEKKEQGEKKEQSEEYKFKEQCLLVQKQNKKLSYNSLFCMQQDKNDKLKKNLFLFKDLVPGVPLTDLVTIYKAITNDDQKEKHHLQLTPLVKYKIIYGIVKYLYDLHNMDKPIIHTEIRPDNIFIDNKFQPHIMGIAKSNQDTKNIRDVVEAYYLPPEAKDTRYIEECNEQIHDKKVQLTDRYDSYMFGCTLFFIITSHHPNPDDKGQDDRFLPSSTNSQYDNKIYQREETQTDETLYYTDYPVLRKIAQWCMKENPKERPSMAQLQEWIFEGAMSVLSDNAFKEFKKFYESLNSKNDNSTDERIGTSYSDCEKAHKFGFSYISDKQPYLKLLFPTDSDTKNKNEERIDIEKQFNEKTDFFMVDKFRALVAEEPQEKTNKK